LMTNTDDFLGTTHINNSSSPTPFSLFRWTSIFIISRYCIHWWLAVYVYILA
jgi:hypothetical protein